MHDELKNILEELVRTIGYEVAVVSEVGGQKDDAEYVHFNIQVERPGPLIGNEGETLAALEFLANLIYFKRHNEWPKLRVNINDYLERQEEKFRQLANKTAERVLADNKPVRLYHLNPKQRRWVHICLADNKGVETFSEGEGDNRCLVVKPAGMEIQPLEEPPLPVEDRLIETQRGKEKAPEDWREEKVENEEKRKTSDDELEIEL